MNESFFEETALKLHVDDCYHLIGIGGSGMSPIARLLLQMNYKVSGSDLQESAATRALSALGATVYIGHQLENLDLATVLVVSSAIDEANPELMAARGRKLPVLRRSEMLELLMQRFAHRVAVAGTHGKTTTTAMTATLLEEAPQSPTYLVGSSRVDCDLNAVVGTGDIFVTESDESDGSFLCLTPNIGIVTNIEEEHMNYFKSRDSLLDHFSRFMTGIVSRKGFVILNQDDATVVSLAKKLAPQHVRWYSLKTMADVSAKNIVSDESGIGYDLYVKGKLLGPIRLKIYGEHNVGNSLAAVHVALSQGLGYREIARGLARFMGTKRRFQKIAEANGVRIYDDYAHHPTEVAATLAAARRSLRGRLTCVFQPHRYSRMQSLMSKFEGVFGAADRVVLCDIYSANEAPIEGVSSAALADILRKAHSEVEYIPEKGEIVSRLAQELKEGDIVVTMGAGDVYAVAHELARKLSGVATPQS